MTNSDNQQLFSKVEILWTAVARLTKSTHILRLIGYGLLLLATFDLFDALIPANFTNPIWEFETLGSLVEQVPIPLIGLALVCMGEKEGRSKWEYVPLKLVSWLALLFGIVFMLLVPLGVFNTFRINNLNNQQITTRENQGLNQVKAVQKQLQGVTSLEQMEAFLQALGQDGSYPEITGAGQLDTAKKQLNSGFENSKTEIVAGAKDKRRSQQLKLLKKSLKWNLGALISSLLFLSVWRGTPWTR